ncbi:hypothetical protein CDL12_06774 [Handroanthus impetiginosus]|uniref:Uncharacterized protein n=1 Tax=Handroanthus impetiginosus TaxID=429701 RepID=A0A2G9HSN3_9LAMI|nr:hypothetical protein CDL12_06774 [Handroanthus impetiginosus]
METPAGNSWPIFMTCALYNQSSLPSSLPACLSLSLSLSLSPDRYIYINIYSFILI